MRDFIIIFEGKEGTSPLVQLLNNFEQISIVQLVNNAGWEPFDRHNCGPMSLGDLERCLDIVYDKGSIDIKQLNRIYLKTGREPVEEFSRNGAVGFKMRFTPPGIDAPCMSACHACNRWYKKFTRWRFRRLMFDLLRRHDVLVFMAVRQDVFRWGLSEYHGDGTGKQGHIQFKLASGRISRDDIDRIHVDCAQLEKLVSRCERAHARKRKLMEDFRLAGIRTYPLIYEQFLTDRHGYFKQLFGFLEMEISRDEIDAAMRKGAYFEKVHPDDISGFVENHEEVSEKFSHRFVSWR